MTQPADDVDRAVAEASRRIGQLATGAFDIPDVREAARQAGFGEAPETITVTGVWLCTFTWEDRDGEHRCDDFREHVEHHCCCGATMQPAKKLTKKKGRRSR